MTLTTDIRHFPIDYNFAKSMIWKKYIFPDSVALLFVWFRWKMPEHDPESKDRPRGVGWPRDRPQQPQAHRRRTSLRRILLFATAAATTTVLLFNLFLSAVAATKVCAPATTTTAATTTLWTTALPIATTYNPVNGLNYDGSRLERFVLQVN